MAVEILNGQRGIEIRDLSGSDIAYDVHVRRVMLRTGLAERDQVDHMVGSPEAQSRPSRCSRPADVGDRTDVVPRP